MMLSTVLFFRRIFWICLLFLFFPISSSLNGSNLFSTFGVEAKKGVLDLRQWDFDRNGVVALEGEWEFYWQQLLTSRDFSKPAVPTKSGFIRVPSYWNDQVIDGQKLNSVGYATYRLVVLMNNEKRKLTLDLGDINSSAEVFVNGKKVSANGKVAALEGLAIELWQLDTNLDSFQRKELEILVHLSN